MKFHVTSGFPVALLHRYMLYGKDPIHQHIFFIACGLSIGYWNYGNSLQRYLNLRRIKKKRRVHDCSFSYKEQRACILSFRRLSHTSFINGDMWDVSDLNDPRQYRIVRHRDVPLQHVVFILR